MIDPEAVVGSSENITARSDEASPDVEGDQEQASVVRDDAGALLGLELANIENTGFNGPVDDQIEHQSSTSPLLGTIFCGGENYERARVAV